MSRQELVTPLSCVQQTFWKYSDRNPLDEGAVFQMIEAAAEDTLGADTAADFVGTLTQSLDPQKQGGFGAQNAQYLEEIGARIVDPEAPVVVKWGALALLGALHTTYDINTVARDDFDITTHHEQVAPHIAYNTLRWVIADPNCQPAHSLVSKALLDSNQNLPTHDLAAEIALYYQPSVENLPQTSDEEDLTVVQAKAINELGPATFAKVCPDAIQKLERMPWLQTDPSSANLYQIEQGGKPTALLFDLTDGNSTLSEFKDDVVTNPATSKQFWDRACTAIIQHTIDSGSSARKLQFGYIPTYYVGNRGGNEGLVRIYYTQLGNHKSTGDPVFGLIGACRTKARELSLLSLLTYIEVQKKSHGS
jgi:hypothetical protein